MKNMLLILQVMVLGTLAKFCDFTEPYSSQLASIDMSRGLSGVRVTPQQTREPVRIAKEINPEHDEIKEWLLEMNDGRLMDLEEGKLAAKLGNREEVRHYGQWMVDEQSKLLKNLNALAKLKDIKLPVTMSEKKAEGLADLKEQSGKDFDKKFLKMMKIDHRRDVRKFKSAGRKIDDKDVHTFITTYRPVIESHLDSLKAID